MKLIRTAALSCTFLLAIGAFAQRAPGGGMPQGGMQQPSSPNQVGPTGQVPNDAQQPNQQQPGAQPQSQAQNAPVNGHPSIDDQVRSLSDQLNLSPDQQAKVKSALEDQHNQAMSVVQDNSLQRDDKIQKIHALREETISKVRTTLNDDQKKKFDQMLQSQDHGQQSAQPKP
jgi:hypothetical protein